MNPTHAKHRVVPLDDFIAEAIRLARDDYEGINAVQFTDRAVGYFDQATSYGLVEIPDADDLDTARDTLRRRAYHAYTLSP